MNAQRIPSIELQQPTRQRSGILRNSQPESEEFPTCRALAQSPAALQGWMSLLEALAKGLLTKKLGASRRRASTSTEATLR